MLMVSVFLIIGSNVAPEEHMKQAVERLREHVMVQAVSSVYETAAQGSGSGTYWNAAVELTTDMAPAAFKLDILRTIERELGRDRAVPSVVPIDLDIALWGHEAIDYGDKPWHAPSKDIVRYAFAAVPLAELAPDYVHPETGQPLADIAASFDRSGIRRLDVSLI